MFYGSGIYGLTDPRNGHIKYIGMSGAIQYRYYDHCQAGAGRKNTPLGNWLKELFSLGLKPSLIILDNDVDYRRNMAERFWIQYFKMLGAELLNIKWVKPETAYTQERYDKYMISKGLPLRLYKRAA